MIAERHHPSPDATGRDAQRRLAADGRADDPDGVRLACGLVDDGPVVGSDEQADVGADLGTPAVVGMLDDGVTEDDERDRGPGGRDALATIADRAARVPQQLDHRPERPGWLASPVVEGADRCLHRRTLRGTTDVRASPRADMFASRRHPGADGGTIGR